jgi:hypothetical protein
MKYFPCFCGCRPRAMRAAIDGRYAPQMRGVTPTTYPPD